MILEHIDKEVDEYATELKAKLESISSTFDEKASTIMIKVRELKKARYEHKLVLQGEIKHLRASLKETWEEWLEVTKNASKQYQFAH